MSSYLDPALAEFPAPMRPDLLEAVRSSADPALVPALVARSSRPAVGLMSGLALDPVARPMFDAALERYTRADLEEIPSSAGEVIVGGGCHAAIYSAVRVASGFPRPLVLEPRRFGGTFALAGAPTFFLNSRNRPGPLGAPGSPDALNVLPAAPMQPADIGSTEYQTDADLGLVARCALALSATVRRAKVDRIERVGNTGEALLVLSDGSLVRAGRVIVATGLGLERRVNGLEPDGRSLFSFEQWLERLGTERFPLADLGRVAVVGAGDSARVVVESLTGLGPVAGSTTAALDYVRRVDWYGIGETTKSEWCARNRSRYQRIGALLPTDGTDNARVIGRPRASLVSPVYRATNVDGRTYDTVITATGYDPTPALDRSLEVDGRYPVTAGGDGTRSTGSRLTIATTTADGRTYLVGPAAGIPFGRDEDSRIGENAVGLFRLAPRTAALAAQLPGLEVPS